MSKSIEELRELADRGVGDGSSESGQTDAQETDDSTNAGGRRTRLGRSPVTAKGLLASFLVAGAGLLVGASVPVPFLGGVLQYVGLLIAAFLLGAVRSRRAYAETAIGGGAAACLLFVANTLGAVNVFLGANFLAEYGVATTGVALAGVGLTAGVVVSLLGYYLGRDLRDGLTRSI